jgi:chromosome segregation ATPase
MAPSPADFSQITELLETKRLYEEVEERNKVKMQEKDEIIASLEREVADLRQTMDQSSGSEDEMRRRLETSQAEVQRVKDEAGSKINALNERIRDLNQRLSQQGGGGGKPTTGGFFKR